MRGPISLSLADELRSIRGGNSNHKKTFRQEPEPEAHNGHDPAWQPEMESMQRTLRQVLQMVTQLSGVELPDPSSPDASESLSRLDFNILKDKIRNNLEAFSSTTVAELSNKAEEKARAALGTIEDQLNSHIEQVAGELRQKLQGQVGTEEAEVELAQQSKDRVTELVKAQTDEFARWVWLTCKGTETPAPAQIEKLLEPYIEEATDNFAASFRQKVQGLIDEQEQVVQEKLLTVPHTVEDHLRSLEQASVQICEQNADSVTQQSAERLNAMADGVVKELQSRFGDQLEGAVSAFQARLVEVAAAAEADLQRDQDMRAQNFREKFEGIAQEVQEERTSEISGRIAQSTADLIESSIQHLQHQSEDSLEHSREEITGFMKLQLDEVDHQIRDLGLKAHESLDRELAEVSDRHMATSREQFDAMAHGCMESMAERIHQAAEQHLEEASRLVRDSQDAVAAQYTSRLQEEADNRFNSLRERIQQEADQAAERVAAGAKAASDSLMVKFSENANAAAAALREEASQATSRIESTLQQSLEAYRQQLEQVTQAGLEEQQKAMSGNVAELHTRLRQAADLLIAFAPKPQ
jgi:hypothetical protein